MSENKQTYTIKLQNGKEILSFSMLANSGADMLAKIIEGKAKLEVEKGEYKNGKKRFVKENFFPKGKWTIKDLYCHSYKFPEMIGRTI